jgi:tetratricopeptide (TPR) repeat protein
VRLILATLGFLLATTAHATAPAAAQDAPDRDARFAEATAAFERGAFESAREGYEALVAEGHASAALYYNLGSTYFRLDELGQAVRYYEKARRLEPGSREVEHNLATVRARLPDPIAEAPVPAPRQWVQWIARNVPAALCYWLGALSYLAAVVLLGMRLWRGDRSAWLRRLLVVAALGSGALLGLAFAASIAGEADRAAVVLRETPLRASLADDAETLREVGEGVVVELLAPPSGPLLHARLPDGQEGYLSAEAAAPI